MTSKQNTAMNDWMAQTCTTLLQTAAMEQPLATPKPFTPHNVGLLPCHTVAVKTPCLAQPKVKHLLLHSHNQPLSQSFHFYQTSSALQPLGGRAAR